MAQEPRIPNPALERLATYLRTLMQLEGEGVLTVSSQEMEQITGVSAAQFRKDLSYFGEFGKRGIGYDVVHLRERIAQHLNIDQEQAVLLVGAGHLGTALMAYPGWRAYHFQIAAIFDRDPTKIGTTIRDLTVQDIADLPAVNARVQARLGILAVPAEAAQGAANELIRAGVTGLINFAPARLKLPRGIAVRDVCFICELAVLSRLVNSPRGEKEAAGSHPAAALDFAARH